MKKFILVLGLLLSSVVFANTAKCRAIIEKFLEQGMYIMVYHWLFVTGNVLAVKQSIIEI